MQGATRKEIEDIKESQEYIALIEYGKHLFLWMLATFARTCLELDYCCF